MNARKPLVAGNWKMNGLLESMAELEKLKSAVATDGLDNNADVMICPPATIIKPSLDAVSGSPVTIGAQDCHVNVSGAHTGDISAEMIADLGASAVIVGHSERRADHGERDKDVKAKAEAGHRAGLISIICIGETAGQRAADLTLDVVKRQLVGSIPQGSTADNTVIAYEPVWAIGTGLTPTVEDVAVTHKAIREELISILGDEEAQKMRVLYGGSVKPANAKELMSVDNVDGALVGGASLKADDFLGIIAAYK